MQQKQQHPRYTYYRMLPGYRGTDSLGCTDCFSAAALDALQSPLMVEEIRARMERIAARWESLDEEIQWIDGNTKATSDHLQWAVWLITSRVLTVQAGGQDGGPPCRLLIPYLGT